MHRLSTGYAHPWQFAKTQQKLQTFAVELQTFAVELQDLAIWRKNKSPGGAWLLGFRRLRFFLIGF